MPTISYNRVIKAPLTYQWSYNGVPNALQNLGVYPISTDKLIKTWVRTPGYRQKVKDGSLRKGDLPMNDFSYQLFRARYPNQVLTHLVGNIQLEVWTGALAGLYSLTLNSDPSGNGIIPIPVVDLDVLYEKALRSTLLEIKDQKINAVQAFAERGQTARLLASSIKRVASCITSLKRGNLGSAGRALGVVPSPKKVVRYKKSWVDNQSSAVANGWLELQYGWKPLLTDIYGAAELIAQKQIREVRNRVRKSASVTIEDRGRNDGASVSMLPFYYDIKRKVSVKYTVYYSSPSVSTSLSQVGISNPALIAWELTPYSFVLDWFIPIGDYISSLDATLGLTFEKGCVTYFSETTCHAIGLPVSKYATSPNVWGSTGQFSSKDVRVTRQVLFGFPGAPLPTFKNPLSFTHVANALALLKTSLRVR